MVAWKPEIIKRVMSVTVVKINHGSMKSLGLTILYLKYF